MERRQIHIESHYKQAVGSAQFLAKSEREEFLSETESRYAFEREQLSNHLQKIPPRRPLAAKILLISGILFTAAAALYFSTDRWQTAIDGIAQHQTFRHQLDEAQTQSSPNERYILNLQSRLRENPNDGELWYELGQAYSLDNEFESALLCYGYAEKLLGERAALFSAMATAEYYLHKQTLTPQAKQWLTAALARDPNDSTALLLQASDSFLRHDFAQAARLWRQVLDSENPAINRKAIIQSLEAATRQMQP